MSRCRVFQLPDGSLRIVHPNPRLRADKESDAVFLARIADETVLRDASLANLPFQDVDCAALPADRAFRHQWRLSGGTVIIDPTVNRPPHPKQAALDALLRSATLDEVKTSLYHILSGHPRKERP